MNSEAIYDILVCKSSALITSFNHFGLCTSYDELMRFQNDMAFLQQHQSKFTMGAFNNFFLDVRWKYLLIFNCYVFPK